MVESQIFCHFLRETATAAAAAGGDVKRSFGDWKWGFNNDINATNNEAELGRERFRRISTWSTPMKQKSWCTDNRTDVKDNLQRSC
jgi:ectoine hydroxylase-related dioxygenase (phytanoyl-CoA dioxygenase family)